MTALWTDLVFAFRSLRRSPGFTAIVALTLALGIGCLTAFWSLLDSVVLRPLPFAEPERLVQLWSEHVDGPGGRLNTSYPDYIDLRSEVDALSHLAAYQPTFANLLVGTAPPVRAPTVFVTHDFFDTLGLPMSHGRDFQADDEPEGVEPTVVISAGLWHQRFGADAGVLGTRIRVDGIDRTVIGVAPGGLDFPVDAALWVPITGLSGLEHRGVHSLQVVGRLAPDAEISVAQERIAQIAGRLREAYPQSNAQLGMRLDDLRESVVGPVRSRLLLVAAAAAFLLLVVCANVSSLLLERATRRRREVATRAALGASHGQLLRQFLAESSVLAVLGAVGALGVAWMVQGLLLEFGPELPRRVETGLDLRALGFAAGITVLLGLLLALAPGLHALGRDLFQRLRVAQVGAEDRRGRRWRASFVVAQVALAVVLTLGAGLLLQSLMRLEAVDLGFDREGVLAVDLEVSTPYVSEEWPATVAFYETLIERLESTPGVESVAAAHQHPADPGWSTGFTVAGEPEPAPGFRPDANFRPVTAGFFATAGIPLLEGEVFDHRVSSEGPGVMVVNRAFVDAFLGGGEAVGRKILRDSWWIDAITEYTIIGVVADTRFAGRHRPAAPAMYLPHRQDIPPMMTLLVKAVDGLDPRSLLPSVRESVWAIDPAMAIGATATLEGLVAETVAVQRFLTGLLTAFAAITLALSALGLYGALAFATARRTRELGLRMALGAGARRLWGMVLGEGLGLAAIGVAIGLVGAWFASRTLEAVLFGVEPGDPATFTGVVVLLALVALAASAVPAWRATRVDPCRALADE